MGFWPKQFSNYWFFVVSLALGFGIQIGLFVYLRNLVKDGRVSGKVLGVTGTTSTAAMISCCTHYLANLLPILGVAGPVTFIAQYQVQLFWLALLFNFGGITYMASKISKFKVHA
jgi:Cu+-exporting ATPase